MPTTCKLTSSLLTYNRPGSTWEINGTPNSLGTQKSTKRRPQSQGLPSRRQAGLQNYQKVYLQKRTKARQKRQLKKISRNWVKYKPLKSLQITLFSTSFANSFDRLHLKLKLWVWRHLNSRFFCWFSDFFSCWIETNLDQLFWPITDRLMKTNNQSK